jgi:ABC-type oligopeptide transport system substrate-binding subunit
MMRKVFVALSLVLAVTLLPLTAMAHEGHDHGTKTKKVKKPKPRKDAVEIVVPLWRV